MGAANPIERKLIDNQVIADFCCEPIGLSFDYAWDLQVVKTGADGNPLISLEVSLDGVKWDSYHIKAIDYALVNDSVTFFDDVLTAKLFRVCVKSNGTTTGNITATIFLKDK